MFLFSVHHLSTMRHINSLPCLVLRLIFSRLPLYDLLQVARVCALWKEYQMDITRKVNSITLLVGVETLERNEITEMPAYCLKPQDLITRSAFTLLHSSDLLDHQGRPLVEPPHSLIFSHLSISVVNQLVESLPNVHTLNISINGLPFYVLEHVIYLLNQWKHSLVTLKLYTYFSTIQINEAARFPDAEQRLKRKLFESFNSLAKLEHLTLDWLDSTNSEDTFDFSFLSRILEFNYDPRPADYRMPAWLTQYGNSAQLRRIGLGKKDTLFLCDKLITSVPFASKFTILPEFLYGFLLIARVFTNLKVFSSLTSLEINFGYPQANLSFADMLKTISVLKHLIHLQIYFNHSLVEFNRISTHALSQLPQVKLLSIEANENKHKDYLESPHWGWIFPNVQILGVKHVCFSSTQGYANRKCPNLEHFDTLSSVPLEVVIEGMRVLLATFKQCPSLRRIHLNDHLLKYKDADVVAKFNFNL